MLVADLLLPGAGSGARRSADDFEIAATCHLQVVSDEEEKKGVLDAMRSVLRRLKTLDLRGKSFVIVAKGIETSTMKVMSQVVSDELGRVPVAVIRGYPWIADDTASMATVRIPCWVAASTAGSTPFTSMATTIRPVTPSLRTVSETKRTPSCW